MLQPANHELQPAFFLAGSALIDATWVSEDVLAGRGCNGARRAMCYNRPSNLLEPAKKFAGTGLLPQCNGARRAMYYKRDTICWNQHFFLLEPNSLHDLRWRVELEPLMLVPGMGHGGEMHQ